MCGLCVLDVLIGQTLLDTPFIWRDEVGVAFFTSRTGMVLYVRVIWIRPSEPRMTFDLWNSNQNHYVLYSLTRNRRTR